MAFYTCSHVGVLYDWISNKQQLLQGHVSHFRKNLKYEPQGHFTAPNNFSFILCKGPYFVQSGHHFCSDVTGVFSPYPRRKEGVTINFIDLPQ